LPAARKGQNATASDLGQERQQVHGLLDLVPPARVGAVRNLLEGIIADREGDDEFTEEDRRRLLESQAWFASGGQGIPMEEVLADFGLTMDDFPLSK